MQLYEIIMHLKNYSCLMSNPHTTETLSVIKQLLGLQAVGTQEEIKLKLQDQGIPITQSQVSRLLRKVGAIKIINEQGDSVYSLPYDLVPPSTQSSLGQLILDIVSNETLIIIHTNPGSASLIAGILDPHSEELKILGTVAGDDTLFVVPISITQIEETLTLIREYLGV